MFQIAWVDLISEVDSKVMTTEYEPNNYMADSLVLNHSNDTPSESMILGPSSAFSSAFSHGRAARRIETTRDGLG